jgi:hypothetical protein
MNNKRKMEKKKNIKAETVIAKILRFGELWVKK